MTAPGRYIARNLPVKCGMRVRRVGACGLWRGRPVFLVGLRHGRGRGLFGRRVLYWERTLWKGQVYGRPVRLDRYRQSVAWLRADRERRMRDHD